MFFDMMVWCHIGIPHKGLVTSYQSLWTAFSFSFGASCRRNGYFHRPGEGYLGYLLRSWFLGRVLNSEGITGNGVAE